MLCADQLLKEAKTFYKIISYPYPVYCPICPCETKHKRKKYHSLKSLSWHVAHEHQNVVGYPFSSEQVLELIKLIGIAIHWGILVPNTTNFQSEPTEDSIRAPIFPRVKRFFDEQ